ncbi:hypothetical protein D3C87_1818240 [compost metagenome]
MGADHDGGLAAGYAGQLGPALGGRHLAGEQFAAKSGGIAQWFQGLEVLRGEDFGWRHEGRLGAALRHGGHGHQRHDRLAGADIALQEARHAVRRGQISPDLIERTQLPLGEGIG